MPLSNYTHAAVLNSVFGKTSDFGALASAPTIYVALSTSTPTISGGNVTEPEGSNYARVETAAADWTSATDADPSEIENAEDIEFPTASGSWGECTHFALYDAGTDGNFLGFGALNTSKTPTDGDTPRFAAGELTVSIGSPA